jgi:hypothetical protein
VDRAWKRRRSTIADTISSVAPPREETLLIHLGTSTSYRYWTHQRSAYFYRVAAVMVGAGPLSNGSAPPWDRQSALNPQARSGTFHKHHGRAQ